MQVTSITRQLDAGAVVLLSNLGFSAAGEVLNCDIYQVPGSPLCTHAMIDFSAVFCFCIRKQHAQH